MNCISPALKTTFDSKPVTDTNRTHIETHVSKHNHHSYTHIPNSKTMARGMRVALLNICSLFHKTLSLFNFLTINKVDVMAINETWLNSSIYNASLMLPGYAIFRLDRPTHGGGVLILVEINILLTMRTQL